MQRPRMATAAVMRSLLREASVFLNTPISYMFGMTSTRNEDLFDDLATVIPREAVDFECYESMSKERGG